MRKASHAGDRVHDERRGRRACQRSTRHVQAVAGVQYSILRRLERCWEMVRVNSDDRPGLYVESIGPPGTL